jgi:hypothetical protein
MRDVQEGDYKVKENYIFLQEKGEAVVGNDRYQVPAPIFDIISCFYYVRSIDFSKQMPGLELNMKTFFDKSIFPVGVKYLGKSTLRTKLGKFRVMVFQPKLIEGRVFKNQRDMKLFVTDDKNQLPIRIQSAVYLDYVYCELRSFSGLKYPLTSKIE